MLFGYRTTLKRNKKYITIKAESYGISLLIYKGGHLNEDKIKTYQAAPLRRNAHSLNGGLARYVT